MSDDEFHGTRYYVELERTVTEKQSVVFVLDRDKTITADLQRAVALAHARPKAWVTTSDDTKVINLTSEDITRSLAERSHVPPEDES